MGEPPPSALGSQFGRERPFARAGTLPVKGANLRRADLRGADPKEANLRDADLQDANLGRDNGGGATSLEGADLGKPREVDFAVIFPTEATALQFAVHLLRNGQKVSFGPYEGDPDRPWQVYGHRVLMPTHEAITAVENALAYDAEPLGGRNDGWGCLAQD